MKQKKNKTYKNKNVKSNKSLLLLDLTFLMFSLCNTQDKNI